MGHTSDQALVSIADSAEQLVKLLTPAPTPPAVGHLGVARDLTNFGVALDGLTAEWETRATAYANGGEDGIASAYRNASVGLRSVVERYLERVEVKAS